MTKPNLSVLATLHLQGADAPEPWTLWHPDGQLGIHFEGQANLNIGFAGTPQEVRLALAKGLAAVDRAEAEREAESRERVGADGLTPTERAELATADALEEPAEASR